MKCPSPRKMPTTTLNMAQHEPDLVPTRPKMAQRKPNMVPTFPNAGPTLHNMTQNETDTAQHGAPNSAMWLKSAPPSCSANQKLALHTLYALPPTPSPRAKLHQLPALFQRFPSSKIGFAHGLCPPPPTQLPEKTGGSLPVAWGRRLGSNITMENHHFSWVNQRTKLSSIANC